MELKNTIIQKYIQSKRFVLFVTEHFIADDCTYRASALAFTTLLAVVPLMTVSFAILSAFPVFQGLSDTVQNFIFADFVPTTGQNIQQHLHQFAAQVSKLSIWGVAFLFVTALLVMYTIEGSMNKIWRVNSARHGVAAFLLYWAILSLAPVLLGLSLAASSYLISLPLIKAHQAPSLLLSFVPSFLSLVGFTFLYVIVPNCHVKIRHGIWGAIVAMFLFETAKQAFAYYLAQYNTYQLLYGAFAAVPIFFVWVYWVWIITLLGAEISYALSVHHKRRPGTPLDGFSHALLWLNQLWLAQLEGKSLGLNDLIDASKRPFSIDINKMISQLRQLQLIEVAENNRFILNRDLNHLTLYEFSKLLPYRLPNEQELANLDASLSKRWEAQLQRVDFQLKDILNMSLEELFSEDQLVEDQ